MPELKETSMHPNAVHMIESICCAYYDFSIMVLAFWQFKDLRLRFDDPQGHNLKSDLLIMYYHCYCTRIMGAGVLKYGSVKILCCALRCYIHTMAKRVDGT